MRLPCFRHTFLLLSVAFFVIGCATDTREKTGNAFPFLDDTLPLPNACNLIASHLCSVLHNSDTASLASFNQALDSAAEAIRKSGARLEAIRRLVYETWGIGFDPRDTLVETLLPHLVFKNRKGACLGVSLIILLLAEKAACPVYGVMLPGHFFCRYDDGNYRINIEPNLSGFAHPDDYYRKQYPVENRPWYGLGNLSAAATLGVFCYNAGTLCLNRKQYGAALFYFRESVRRIPDFAEAKGNLALAYARKGNLDTAEMLFKKLFLAHPDLPGLSANYGAVAMAVKQYRTALDIFRKGLEHFPGDTALCLHAAEACSCLGLDDSADVFRRSIRMQQTPMEEQKR